ncbi:PCYCGC domain-containing protein [Paenibacillus spongiae]|uniref:PCYCGC domain-containing protein n=1 Tax=Paenibacillus spongiae TaxID=2909671 RepID=A0ABY5SFJ9_9BACL|nr:PCYCGC domain-containing protein [Paenibacillus spongiae]UVI32255.1 PCYCGC domain-containing protein [Paenibacillus spongiae]
MNKSFSYILRRGPILAACAVALAAVMSGCSGNSESPSSKEANAQQHSAGQTADAVHLPNGDMQQTTGNGETLPAFLDGASEMIVVSYKTAAANRDLLKSIPCYCGCGESAGHRSNLQCFINETKEDGSVVWDDHGTRCGVCMETAIISAAMHEEGKSIKDIRDAIHTRYDGRAAAPTDTPMPES